MPTVPPSPAATLPAPAHVGVVSRPLRVTAWISLITEILIIGTGGAVRLTGSGLGCEWPLCAPDSLFPVAGMGLHSYIEFGNRLMSGVVGLAALAVLLLVWRIRRERRDLFAMAWIIIGGVLVQALVGGITVLADLNMGVVSFHFFASLTLVVVATAFLMRAHTTPGPRRRVVPGRYIGLVHAAAGLTVLTLAVGILTTANGPHSGDSSVVRHAWNPTVLAHVHSVPGYLLLAAAIAMVVVAAVKRLPLLRWAIVFLVLLLLQVPLGVYQARNGLPALAVGSHMILAGLLAAVMTVLVMSVRVRDTDE